MGGVLGGYRVGSPSDRPPRHVRITPKSIHSGGADAGGDASSDDEADAHPGDVGGNGSSSRPRKPCRIVEKDGGRGLVRVHWVGYPESYDEWRGAGEAPAGAAEDLDAGKGGAPFHVCCRFVADVDRFNEWGREGDYLPTAMAGPSSSAGGAAASSATTPRGGGGSGASHRKAQPSSAASSVASVPVLDRVRFCGGGFVGGSGVALGAAGLIARTHTRPSTLVFTYTAHARTDTQEGRGVVVQEQGQRGARRQHRIARGTQPLSCLFA